MTEEKKKREAAEQEKQELQDRLKAFELERERQAEQLEETRKQTQELEEKAKVHHQLSSLLHLSPLPLQIIPPRVQHFHLSNLCLSVAGCRGRTCCRGRSQASG